MRVAIFLALRTLWRGGRGHTILTTTIMAVVFLNLLFIGSIFTGVGVTMDQQKIRYQFGDVFLEVADGEEYIRDANGVVRVLRDIPGFRQVTVRLITGATVYFDRAKDGRHAKTMSAAVLGIDPAQDDAVVGLSSTLLDGRYIRAKEYDVAMIGAELAGGYGSGVFQNDLGGVRVGDVVTVTYGNGVTKEYRIVGVYKTKNFEADARIVVPRAELDRILGTRAEATEIMVRTDTPQRAFVFADEARARLGDDVKVSDWYQKLAFGRSINQAFDVIGFILQIIGAIVAGLVIFVIMFIDVVNRRKQIGVLRALGVPRAPIVWSYVLRGMFYTFVGIVVGLLLMRYGIITYYTLRPIDFPMGPMVPALESAKVRSGIILFIIAGMVGSAFPVLREVRKPMLTLMR